MRTSGLRTALLCRWAAMCASQAGAAPRAGGPDPLDPLPGDTLPAEYRIDIVPDGVLQHFDGDLLLKLDVLRPTRQVSMNAHQLAFESARADGRLDARIVLDEARQRVTFSFDETLAAGRHELHVRYSGRIGEQVEGLFRVAHPDGAGGSKSMLMTHLCCAVTGRLFVPLWDDPGVKAVFELSIAVPSSMEAVSNMPVVAREPLPEGLTRFRFRPTPRMSSYLLFVAAGEFDRVAEKWGGVDVGVITQRGKAEQGRFALGAMLDALRYYTDYFGIPYALPKLDSIAIPGTASFGAMENWGAMLFGEPYLLIDPALSTEADRQAVYVTEVHEVAHQWFGNLVTMKWWDDLWLNESFATWMSTKMTHAQHPEWGMWLHAGESREVAMDLDARDVTHPVLRKVVTAADASEAFDAITYEKGQAVLRMLESYVGEDVFRNAVRAHIGRHAYGNAVTEELWAELDKAAKFPVSAIARDFTKQAGVPLIDVAASRCTDAGSRTELQLKQGRFGLEAGSKAARKWRVPVNASVVDSGEVARGIVSGEGVTRMSLKGCGPVKVNAGESGYFRVRYEPEAFAALSARFDGLSAADQLGLLSDSYALAVGGYQGFEPYFALAEKLSPASNPVVLTQFVRTARALDRLHTGLSSQPAFRSFVRERLRPWLAALSWARRGGESPNASILRAELIELLAELGDPAVQAEVARRFRLAERNPETLSGDLRKVVMSATGAGASPETLQELFDKATRSRDSARKAAYFIAAAQARDPAVAARALELTLRPEVPPQLFSTLIQAVATRHPQLTFDFATSRYAQLKSRLSGYQQLSIVPFVAGQSADPVMADRLRAFMRVSGLNGAEVMVRRALSDIAVNSQLRSKGVPQIDALIEASRKAAIEPVQRLPTERYLRAQSMMAGRVTSLVLNAAVVPHWVGRSDEFWYDRELPDGHEFVLVDAVSGSRRPAFDHERVASALSIAAGQAYEPRHLPFTDFSFSENRGEIRFAVGDAEYAVSLGSGSVAGEDEGSVSARRLRPAKPDPAFSLSPGGRWGATTRGGNLWLRDMESGEERALTRDGQPDSGYGIWPDGYSSYYVPRAAKAATMSGEPVGASGAPTGIRWSPDGRRFFVPHFDQRHVMPYPMIDSAPPDGSLRPRLYQPRLALVGEKPARVEWYVFDVESTAVGGRKVDLPVDEMLAMQADILPITAVSWREDGRRLYAVAHGDNMESAFLFDIDAVTGSARKVIDDRVLPRTDLNTTSYNLPTVWVSPDGRDAIWFSQRDGWGHLYLYDIASGRLRNRITSGPWLVREIIRVDPVERVVYFTGTGREPGNPYHRYLYRARFDGSQLKLLTPEPADHMIMPPERLFYAPDGIPLHQAISPSGRYVVYTYSTVSDPPRSVIRETREGRLVAPLEEADASALFAAGWRAPEEFTATAADGVTKLHGVLYKPRDFDPGRKYPVLDAQYASPLISVTPHNFYQSLAQDPALDQATYAELGFIVMTVDGRGTTGRSKAFSQVKYGHLDVNGLDDHVAALRELGAKRPYLDLDKVGVYGVSYGGYMTIRAMLGFPDFFKVGIATAGIAVIPGMFADYHWSAFQGRPRYADGTALQPDVASIPGARGSMQRQGRRLRGQLMLELSELDEDRAAEDDSLHPRLARSRQAVRHARGARARSLPARALRPAAQLGLHGSPPARR